MHELSIAQAVVDQLEKLAMDAGAKTVPRVTLAVGALSGVDPEALRMAFPIAADETLAAGAELIIEQVPAKVRCLACGDSSVPDFPVFVCCACGSADVEFLAGRELLIRSAEVMVS